MHDIWNPWHGCVRCSEGCENCYMSFLDDMRDKNGSEIYVTANARYPLARDRRGHYKIQSGEKISVCMTSDFFLKEADQWRADAWDVMRQRRDVIFIRKFNECGCFVARDVMGMVIAVTSTYWPQIEEYLEANKPNVNIIK